MGGDRRLADGLKGGPLCDWNWQEIQATREGCVAARHSVRTDLLNIPERLRADPKLITFITEIDQ